MHGTQSAIAQRHGEIYCSGYIVCYHASRHFLRGNILIQSVFQFTFGVADLLARSTKMVINRFPKDRSKRKTLKLPIEMNRRHAEGVKHIEKDNSNLKLKVERATAEVRVPKSKIKTSNYWTEHLPLPCCRTLTAKNARSSLH
jgi:hypothetical protein